MTKEPKGGKLPERVAQLEQKDETDDIRCNARHTAEHLRIDKLEVTIMGTNRDGTGGLVASFSDLKNDLKNTMNKMAVLFGIASFLGSAVGIIVLQYIAGQVGLKP